MYSRRCCFGERARFHARSDGRQVASRPFRGATVVHHAATVVTARAPKHRPLRIAQRPVSRAFWHCWLLTANVKRGGDVAHGGGPTSRRRCNANPNPLRLKS